MVSEGAAALHKAADLILKVGWEPGRGPKDPEVVAGRLKQSAPTYRIPEDPEIYREFDRAALSLDDLIRQLLSWVERIPALEPRRKLYDIHHRLEDLHGILMSCAGRRGYAERPVPIDTVHEKCQELSRRLAEETLPILSQWLTRGESVRVLDTSALLESSDLRRYEDGPAHFVIPPIVLREVDDLRHHSDAEKRRLAHNAHRALKKWESKGDPIAGVEARGGRVVRFLPADSSLGDLPAEMGLSASKPDDLILGATWDLTRQMPADVVILCSGDLNLRTRARGLNLEVEPAPPQVDPIEVRLGEIAEEIRGLRLLLEKRS